MNIPNMVESCFKLQTSFKIVVFPCVSHVSPHLFHKFPHVSHGFGRPAPFPVTSAPRWPSKTATKKAAPKEARAKRSWDESYIKTTKGYSDYKNLTY